MAIVNDALAQKATVSGYRRVLRTCESIGIPKDESEDLLHRLSYHDGNGNPYLWLKEKLESK